MEAQFERLDKAIPQRSRQIDTESRLGNYIGSSYGLKYPHHLESLLKLIERTKTEEVRAVVSVPPQFGKSYAVLHALSWLLSEDAKKRHAYASYAQQFTRDQSLIARNFAQQHGVPLQVESLDRWTTPQGGGVTWTSTGGPLTGRPVDGVLFLDDLLKGRQEAESALVRRRTMEWLSSVAFSRLHPGASVILISTRWHPEDPAGQLKARGWEYVNLPAISPDGEPLWPEARPLAWLERQRAQMTEYDWFALYMGEPRPRGGTLFNEPSFYTNLPEGPYKTGCGADWAYTAKSHADYSVALEGRLYGEQLYITNMIRMQVEAPKFAEQLRGIEARKIHSYMSGTEKALEQFIRKTLNIDIVMLPTNTDKYVRAQSFATRWNRKDVLVPDNKPWTPVLLDEVLSFTGISDVHDDIVDAGSSLEAAFRVEEYQPITVWTPNGPVLK